MQVSPQAHRSVRRGQRLAGQGAGADVAGDTARSFNDAPRRSITPELLAALAQVESSGNPVARTYWRWRFSWNPFELYQPASSAVGMFQITAGTFAEARRYCIHDHVVVEEGALGRPALVLVQRARTRVWCSGSCRGDDRRAAGSRGRAHPRHVTGMTTASLSAAAKPGGRSSTCAETAPVTNTRAGASDSEAASDAATTTPSRYLAQVNALKRQFARLAATD